jgi:hypothetical protein
VLVVAQNGASFQNGAFFPGAAQTLRAAGVAKVFLCVQQAALGFISSHLSASRFLFCGAAFFVPINLYSASKRKRPCGTIDKETIFLYNT